METPTSLVRSILGCAALLLACAVGAAEGVDGYPVLQLQIKETGNLLVRTGLHANPGACSQNSVVMVSTDHPAYRALVAAAMAARATAGRLRFQLDGCVSAYGETWPLVAELTWE